MNLEQNLSDKEQEKRSLQNEERRLLTSNIFLERAVKELINTIDPTLLTNNDLTTFNEAKLISVLKELKEEYNKISKEKLLKELDEIKVKKSEIKHIGGNLEDLNTKVNQFYNDKIILMARLTELQKKIQNIVSLYNKILSGENKIEKILDLEKQISSVSTKITGLTKNEKILKNLKTKLDKFKSEIDRLESKLTPRIIESINSMIDDLEKNIMLSRREIMFTEDFVKKIFKPDKDKTAIKDINVNNISGIFKTSPEGPLNYDDEWNVYALDRIAQMKETRSINGNLIEESIYDSETIKVAISKWIEIMGMPYQSSSGTMNKYKFNLININLQGGTLPELLVKMKNFTKNKQDIIVKIINLKKEMDKLITNSNDKELSKDKYISIDKNIQDLENEINKLPESLNISAAIASIDNTGFAPSSDM